VKKVQVIWSTEALVDLETIYDFLAEHSQQVAQKVIEKILSRIGQIETFPESGSLQSTLKKVIKSTVI
jgi:plasmid stabilization system protein ParE